MYTAYLPILSLQHYFICISIVLKNDQYGAFNVKSSDYVISRLHEYFLVFSRNFP